MATNNKTLNSHSQPVSQASIALDVNTPLSFRDWYNSHTGLISGQEYSQYNVYLTEWYQAKQAENQNSTSQLRLAYLSLLRQLQIFSTTAEVEQWYTQINFEDDREILIAIPYFARKLKDIALYYLQLREEVKKSKIRYNHIGTNKGIIQHLQELLLTNFTKKQTNSVTLPASLWVNIPELSSVKDTLTITVEELYDDHHYGDQSATLPASAYYDFNNITLKNFFETKNINLSSTEWIYKQGNTNISILDIVNNIEFASDIYTKYIGEEKYIDLLTQTNTPLVSTLTDFYSVFINEGINYFFWPYGPYKPDVSTITRYNSVALTAAKIENLGTSNTDIANADTIFTKTAEGIEGAWLRFKQFDEYDTVIETYLEGNKKTVFKFPYPGYGLSAENTNWTGPGLKYNSEFYYLDKDIKKTIEQEYWNFDISLSGADSIKIADTTLATQGAYASEKYDLADKIRLRKNAPTYTDSAAYGDIEEAWLYKMTKTDIPLTVGDNLIFWPYQRITNEASLPTYFPTDVTSICEPIALSGLSVPFATSSDSISSADIIYKLKNYTDNESQAVECAWLSGSSYANENYNGISQTGLNIIFTAGTITRFVWEGDNNTDINTVFKSIQHQPDCTFSTTASSYQDHTLCTCRSVLFTPFGHPGSKYTDNNSLADYIVEVTNNEVFDLDNWKDKNGTTYQTSSAFAYFKTNKKIGWGDGRWYSGSSVTNNTFKLQKGRAYIYNRTTDPKTQTPREFPFLVVRYPYNNNKNIWITATKTFDNTWVSLNTPSNMQLLPGDILLYKKIDKTSYSSLSSDTTNVTQSTAINYNSIWSNFDFLTVGENQLGVSQTVTVSYPNPYYPMGALDDPNLTEQYKQYPRVSFGNVVYADWELTDPYDSQSYIFNSTSFTFNPLVTGLYTVSVTALTAAQVVPNGTYAPGTTGFYIFTDIPAITATNYNIQTTTVVTSTYQRNVPGFVINTPLYGWNYNYGLPSKNSNGAKPYWAQGNTTYKDIISWGASFRLVDDYNVVTQPFFSEIVLETGNYIEYDRKYQKSITWYQPINYKIQVNENIWSAIEINTSAISNLEPLLYNLTNQVTLIPTENISPMQLRNVVQNEPVEVYYKAAGSFVWNISAIPEIDNEVFRSSILSRIVDPLRPWNNLTNRFNPSYAVYPAFDSLYSKNDKGGYFTPNHLGLSVYLNKDYTVSLSLSSSALSGIFENPDIHVGGRGFTKQDQPTPFTNIIDNNIWLKEPVVSGSIAGTIKKNVTKKYQKFLPYQSTYDTNPNIQTGIILPMSRQTPWGGNNDSEWTDTANKPQNFSGVVNTSAWSATQELKQLQNKQLDTWTTDIFGNQYGLYKNIANVAPYERRNVQGELWVRKNSQSVQSAQDALSAVFDSYTGLNLLNDLTGSGITKVDVFFDTLYIETTGVVLLEDLDYDYDTDTISSFIDNTRTLSLAVPIIPTLSRELTAGTAPLTGYNYGKVGDTWFFPQEKSVVISTCYISNSAIYPELYKLDINTKQFSKIFPVKNEDIISTTSLFANALSIERPVLTYSNTTNEFLYSVVVNNDHLVELVIKNLPQSNLITATTYIPTTQLNTTPSITHTLDLTATTLVTFTYQITATNNPTSYTIADSSFTWITVTDSGLFTGTPIISGTYNVPFTVSNSYGPIYYTLNITVSS